MAYASEVFPDPRDSVAERRAAREEAWDRIGDPAIRLAERAVVKMEPGEAKGVAKVLDAEPAVLKTHAWVGGGKRVDKRGEPLVVGPVSDDANDGHKDSGGDTQYRNAEGRRAVVEAVEVRGRALESEILSADVRVERVWMSGLVRRLRDEGGG